MPKKFGNNTKSVEARARREALKQAEKEKKDQEAEDALWTDHDKHVLKKQQRKEDKDKKKNEQLEKKQTLKKLYEEEMSTLKSAKVQPSKLTRADIEAMIEKQQAGEDQAPPKQTEMPLEENINHLMMEDDSARTIDEAIAVLNVKEGNVDRHPERRLKAAYQAFEDKYLPILKAENPNLRLSQLKQMIKKDWMKSPENPLNKMSEAYNVKT